MRRRLPLLTAALTLLLALPAGASAAILDVRIDTAAGPALCVSTSGLVTSVTVIVGRPGGATLAKLASSRAPGHAVRRQRGAQLPPGTAVRAGWTAPPERASRSPTRPATA